jgi:hypothetical protein
MGLSCMSGMKQQQRLQSFPDFAIIGFALCLINTRFVENRVTSLNICRQILNQKIKLCTKAISSMQLPAPNVNYV